MEAVEFKVKEDLSIESSSSASRIAALREHSGILKSLPKKEILPFSKLDFGIPKGAITEITGALGSGKTEFVLNFLSEHPELKIVWVEKNFSIYPFSFIQRNVDLKKVLFLELSSLKEDLSPPFQQQENSHSKPTLNSTLNSIDLLWVFGQLLRSDIFSILVVSGFALEEMELRRLQIHAERSQACVILINESTTKKSWPISVQIQIQNHQIRVLKA